MLLDTNYPEYMHHAIEECPRGHLTIWCTSNPPNDCPTCVRKGVEVITNRQIDAMQLDEVGTSRAYSYRYLALQNEQEADRHRQTATYARLLHRQSPLWLARHEMTTHARVVQCIQGCTTLARYFTNHSTTYSQWLSTLRYHRGHARLEFSFDLPQDAVSSVLSDLDAARKIIGEAEEKESQKEEEDND